MVRPSAARGVTITVQAHRASHSSCAVVDQRARASELVAFREDTRIQATLLAGGAGHVFVRRKAVGTSGPVALGALFRAGFEGWLTGRVGWTFLNQRSVASAPSALVDVAVSTKSFACLAGLGHRLAG